MSSSNVEFSFDDGGAVDGNTGVDDGDEMSDAGRSSSSLVAVSSDVDGYVGVGDLSDGVEEGDGVGR